MAHKGLVLVTGANGYIAASTVEAFLKAGYSVRGTVRKLSSTDKIKEALSEYADQLEFAEVPDITVPGAFDEAVKGVDAVAHLASPVSFDFTDPEPVLKSAINGTVRALESAQKEPKIKNFVLMSSIVAVLQQREEDYTYTEKDWNTFAEDVVAKEGKATPGPIIYFASKVAAEKAMWKFRDEHKPTFTLTSINPAFVAGPPLVTPGSADEISMSNRLIPDVFAGKPLDQAGIPGAYNGYVDIRDVARLVVFGVEHPEKANKERFIAASYYAPAQAVADILREEFPERAEIIEKGTPGEGYFSDYRYLPKMVYDGTKAVRATGQDYIPWRQTVLDTVEKVKAVFV
ncbi:hypothetical protein C8A01DRAFT_18094 [Parachaetomium inaequale]|uniref:NAD-dependent epimerase/dehydratase domain-containing protein n=1 Tax=Parachaetomium inaequale TaxID=2588326 RepID=A0AAN6SNS5_9PEZI|nr:hypothetical protein C8A01DRAFT_18094 [Parachaetomium inaequale]